MMSITTFNLIVYQLLWNYCTPVAIAIVQEKKIGSLDQSSQFKFYQVLNIELWNELLRN